MTAEDSLALVVGSQEMRDVLYSMLEGQGYRVATCGSGFDALKYVARCKPELILSEARLEDITGRELSSAVKTISPATRVVVMNSDSLPETRGDGPSSRGRRAPGPESL